jgi:hypothetical protein
MLRVVYLLSFSCEGCLKWNSQIQNHRKIGLFDLCDYETIHWNARCGGMWCTYQVHRTSTCSSWNLWYWYIFFSDLPFYVAMRKLHRSVIKILLSVGCAEGFAKEGNLLYFIATIQIHNHIVTLLHIHTITKIVISLVLVYFLPTTWLFSCFSFSSNWNSKYSNCGWWHSSKFSNSHVHDISTSLHMSFCECTNIQSGLWSQSRGDVSWWSTHHWEIPH